jgi:class 3 adenylate cyclase
MRLRSRRDGMVVLKGGLHCGEVISAVFDETLPSLRLFGPTVDVSRALCDGAIDSILVTSVAARDRASFQRLDAAGERAVDGVRFDCFQLSTIDAPSEIESTDAVLFWQLRRACSVARNHVAEQRLVASTCTFD